MAQSNAERSASYRRRRKQMLADPGAAARAAIDGAVAVMWALHQRGEPLIDADPEDFDSYRRCVASSLAAGAGSTKLRAWLAAARTVAVDGEELAAIDRAIGVVQAVHLVQERG